MNPALKDMLDAYQPKSPGDYLDGLAVWLGEG
jgi:hypothetical protein